MPKWVPLHYKKPKVLQKVLANKCLVQLEAVAQVREPGRTLSHIEFTKDGRYALASLMEMNGAVIVYDAQTFKEITRLPMSKPIGKYNVWNKISRSEGTSH